MPCKTPIVGSIFLLPLNWWNIFDLGFLWGLEQLHIQFKESMLVHGRRKFKVARRWRKKKATTGGKEAPGRTWCLRFFPPKWVLSGHLFPVIGYWEKLGDYIIAAAAAVSVVLGRWSVLPVAACDDPGDQRWSSIHITIHTICPRPGGSLLECTDTLPLPFHIIPRISFSFIWLETSKRFRCDSKHLLSRLGSVGWEWEG